MCGPLCRGRQGKSSLRFGSQQPSLKDSTNRSKKPAASEKEMENCPAGELPAAALAVSAAGPLPCSRAGVPVACPLHPSHPRDGAPACALPAEGFFQGLGTGKDTVPPSGQAELGDEQRGWGQAECAWLAAGRLREDSPRLELPQLLTGQGQTDKGGK